VLDPAHDVRQRPALSLDRVVEALVLGDIRPGASERSTG
jgi:hypothetical protein